MLWQIPARLELCQWNDSMVKESPFGSPSRSLRLGARTRGAEWSMATRSVSAKKDGARRRIASVMTEGSDAEIRRPSQAEERGGDRRWSNEANYEADYRETVSDYEMERSSGRSTRKGDRRVSGTGRGSTGGRRR